MRRSFPLVRLCQCSRNLSTLSTDQFNAYISQSIPAAPPIDSAAPGSLRGRTIALKDNICTNDDLPTSCASTMLNGYCSPFDATVVSLLKDAGAVITGKTNMDEFAMGSTSTNNLFNVINPHRGNNGEELCAGGSSGGSAAAVAAGLAWGAIGTDTGGSVRLPAAYCGIVGFKPTYGLISRYGVVSYAHSLDTVGIFSRDIESARTIFDTLNKHDKRDPTALPQSIRSRFPTEAPKKWTIGVPAEYNLPSLHPAMSRAWAIAISLLQSAGHSITRVSLPRTKEALSAYYVLATAEAASNLARYDGVRYGYHVDSDVYREGVLAARAKGFGEEVRRRILLGNYTLSARAFESYFIQAQRVRRLIQYSFDDVFSHENILHRRPQKYTSSQNKCDVILCPTTIGPAPELSTISSLSPVETYINDVFTVPASLAGLPAINIPVNLNGHILGLQLLGQVGTDTLLLHLSHTLQSLLRSTQST